MQIYSQDLLKKEQKVKVVINNNGDTLIQMNVEHARLILKEVSNKKITDNILKQYIVKDSLNSALSVFQIEKDRISSIKEYNSIVKIENLEKVVNNKDTEITILNSVIKSKDSEIKKIKLKLKIIGLGTAIVIPIILTLLIK